jgi:hypothetical protein
MPPGKSTRPSNAFFDIPEFELPVDREFDVLAPQLNLREYCRLNQEFRKMFPKGIPTEEERLARKFPEVFVF